MRCPERGELIVVDGLHRALELAGVCLERVELALDERPSWPPTSSTWSGSSASNSSSAVGPMVRRGRARGRSADRGRRRCRRRRAARHVDGRGAGDTASTGRARARRRDAARGCTRATSPRISRPLSSSPSTLSRNTTKPALSPLSAPRCFALLELALRDERGHVGIRIPRALRPVGADRGGARRSRRRPTWPTSRRSRTRRRRDVRRSPARSPASSRLCAYAALVSAGWPGSLAAMSAALPARVDGRGRPVCRCRGRAADRVRTRPASPASIAADRCRRNEPGP